MQRQSPPTDRVVQVLDFLAASPEGRHGVSDIARRTGLSKPTCIGIVHALSRAGYLDYDERRRSYALGPSLVALGRAAQERLLSLGGARPVIERLADHLGIACTASAVTDSHLTIVERSGPPTLLDPLIRVGQRLPLRPPTGKLAFVWRGDEQLARWLDGWATEGPLPDLETFGSLVARCRKRGYLIEGLGEGNRRLWALLRTLPSHALTHDVVGIVSQVAAGFSAVDLLPLEPMRGGRHAVSTVSAPVYDAGGEVALILIAYVAAEDVPASKIEGYGRAVAAAAREVTALVGGHDPWAGTKFDDPSKRRDTRNSE